MGEHGYWNRAARRSGGYRPRPITERRATSETPTHSAACAVLSRHDVCDFAGCQCECHEPIVVELDGITVVRGPKP
jgi:hypothetical protein